MCENAPAAKGATAGDCTWEKFIYKKPTRGHNQYLVTGFQWPLGTGARDSEGLDSADTFLQRWVGGDWGVFPLTRSWR